MIGCLWGDPAWEHACYLRSKRSAASPFNCCKMRASRTACLKNSTGRYPSPRGGNTSTRRRSCQIRTTSSMKESWRNGTIYRNLCRALDRLRVSSREIYNIGRWSREILLSPSLRLTQILSKRCGYGFRGGAWMRLTPPHPHPNPG